VDEPVRGRPASRLWLVDCSKGSLRLKCNSTLYGEKAIPAPHRRPPRKVPCTGWRFFPVPHLRYLSGRSEASHWLDGRAPRRLLFARRLHGSSARGEDCLERDQRVWGAVHSHQTRGASTLGIWSAPASGWTRLTRKRQRAAKVSPGGADFRQALNTQAVKF
jgi:hypothetical protein